MPTSRGGSDAGDTGAGSVAAWNQSWRDDATRQLHESAKAQQQTALIQERVLGRLDDHDRRIGILEAQPERTRANIASYGGCSSQLVMMAIIVFDALLSLAGLTTAIVSLLLHH